MTNPPELETRRKIYEAVVLSPGIHFRELQRTLEMPVGLLDYHLNHMVKKEVLILKQDKYYSRYYPRDRFSTEEKDILSCLRQELPRGIILYLFQNQNSRHKDILENFKVSGATLSYHLKKMAEKEVVLGRKVGRESEYTLKNPERVRNLLITYRRSFLDKLVDSFARAWLESEQT